MEQRHTTKRSRPRRRSGPGRLSAADAALLPERLLDAAAALFLEDGYAKTTMDGIARKAQASTKTVYSRYDNKAEILAAVISGLVDRTLAKATADISAKLDTGDPRKFLHDIGLQFATLVSEPQTVGINRLVIAEAAQFPELVRSFAQGPGRAVDIIRAAIEQWQHEGKLPVLLEPQTAATIFYDIATSTPRMQALLGSPLNRRALEAHVNAGVDLFLRGLSRDAQSADGSRRAERKQTGTAGSIR